MICIDCGEQHNRKRSDLCKKCVGKRRKKRQREGKSTPLGTKRICNCCKTEYTVEKPGQLYCEKCKNMTQFARDKKMGKGRQEEEKKCFCGETFMTKRPWQQIYCEKCKVEARREVHRRSNRKAAAKKDKNYCGCGKEISRMKKYCDKCRKEEIKIRNKEYRIRKTYKISTPTAKKTYQKKTSVKKEQKIEPKIKNEERKNGFTDSERKMIDEFIKKNGVTKIA